MADGTSKTTRSPRFWCRFSLRTFAVLFTVFAVWLAIKANQARDQKAAVDVVRKLGGQVEYNYQPAPEEHVRRSLERQADIAAGRKPRVYRDGPLAPQWLVNLFGEDLFATVVAVDLSQTMATDADIATISRLPFIRRLRIESLPNLTDNGLKSIGRMKRLESLDIGGNNLVGRGYTAQGLAHLSGLRRLVSLRMSNSHIGDDAMRHVGELTELDMVFIEGTNVTAAGLAHLNKLTRLNYLGISMPVDNSVLANLAPLKNVKFIPGLAPTVTDAGLRHLRDFRRLTQLDLTDTQVTDRGLEILPTLRRLERLSLTGTRITDEGLAYVATSGKLNQLELARTDISDVGLQHLAHLVNLTSLWLGDTHVSGSGMIHLSECRQLESLQLANTDLNDEGLAMVGRLTRLKFLDLGNTRITDAGMKHIAGLTSLEQLSLRLTQITNEGLQHLRAIPTLKSLILVGTNVSDDVEALFAQWEIEQ